MRTFPASVIENGQEGGAEPLAVAEVLEEGPLVSCLMVTRGRLFPARFAVACFRSQTYGNRELVVVVDDPACELVAYLAGLADPRIRVVNVPPGSTLGELRNVSVASARGEYVCQWDDDDLYAPARVETQLAALLATGAAACVLRRWTVWWPETRRIAVSRARLWEGSILALKAAVPAYPALRRGEDTQMMQALVERARVLSLEAPELYVYIHHGGNTFSEEHFFNIYNLSRQRWVGDAYWERLDGLAATLPVREFLQEIPAAPRSGEEKAVASGACPLVSIVVRSMGRPELALALASLAAQDYPALEVIVVDATGGRHPPLPDIAWRPGHAIRIVGAGRALPRPEAANAGLDAVTGEWFGFLDDDDSFDADHISTLMKAALATDRLVVYGMTRFVNADGEAMHLYGFPFNRAIMFYGPLFYLQSALIRRSVLGLGCRFDARFEISEDRDFCAQIAEHSDFAYVRHVGFNYGAESGTSGTGSGQHRDLTRLARFEQLLRYKWLGAGAYHTARVANACKRGVADYVAGDVPKARATFDAVLREYPDDPNAMNGLGYIALMDGELEEAERILRRAVEINPASGESRLHLATALERAGRHAEAQQQAWRAAADPGVREAALQVLARLGGPPSRPDAEAPVAAPESAAPSRMAPCPCGSGRRYKQCCGQLGAAPAAAGAEAQADDAVATFLAGEAFAALEMLLRLSPGDLTRAETALACGDICAQLARFEEAYGFFRRAAALGEASRAAEGVTRACQQWYKSERDAPTRRMVLKLAARFSKRPRHPDADRPDEIHVVAALRQTGGSEHQAIGLFEQLSPHTRVRIWSTVPPLPAFARRCPVETIDAAQGHHPRSGHLVFLGTYFEYGSWLERCQAHRVTLCYNIDNPASLIERLVELEAIPTAFALDFSFPSRTFRDAVALDGAVEYAPVDLRRFRPSRARSSQSGPMVVGRHSRDDPLKFHPDDPAFFRRVAALGHAVRITGGTCLKEILDRRGRADGIVLLPETQDGVVEFLDGLDCFVYRVHPHLYETGGTVILEAMAMGLPVVLFAERVGIAELIEHGRNGFIVASEDEALACIRQLAGDPRLRHAVGEAARATLVALMDAQARATIDFYLRGSRAGSPADHEFLA
jgi:glycosyltransferase involved in cell wall biosynthesis